jgi:hypothetical protein
MLQFWPQIVYLSLLGAGLVIVLTRHGKPKEGNYDARIDLFSSALVLLLLYFGGFFSPSF